MYKNYSSSQLVSVVYRLLSYRLQDAFLEHDIPLTTEQFRLLFYLWQRDGISQRELARIANKEKSTITRQINDLERKGYIHRYGDKADKRNKLITVSELGRGLQKKTLAVADDITQEFEEGLGADELKIFRTVLIRMIENLTIVAG